MNEQDLSSKYTVRRLTEEDIPKALRMCKGNPQYYEHFPPKASAEGIRTDMGAVPNGKDISDKFYLGFIKGRSLVAILDLVLAYPDKNTAYIGFFMLNSVYQGKGVGSQIISEVCDVLRKDFKFVKLAYVQTNEQSAKFWRRNGFVPTGDVKGNENLKLVITQKTL